MVAPSLQKKLHALIRTVPNWPKPGVQFRDITPLLQAPDSWNEVLEYFAEHYRHTDIHAIAGLEARGFIFGAALAHAMHLPFIPIRKQGNLPFQTVSESYELEYGSATIEIHIDACQPSDKVLLADDLIATGGTLLAAQKLLQRLGAIVIEAAVIIDLPELGGTAKCTAAGLPIRALIQFESH